MQRLCDAPIVTPQLDKRIGSNINGPSLIRAPDWIKQPLGRYYLYFAHHLGGFIRLAFADDLTGPWKVHTPGVLDLPDAPQLFDHIASPDVHVDDELEEIRMYVHGVSELVVQGEPPQSTCVALSKDGLNFDVLPGLLGESYFRVWQWDGWHYAVSLGGRLWRSKDGLSAFERGPMLANLPQTTRHLAALCDGDRLWLAWSAIGDRPERIFAGVVDLSKPWMTWRAENVHEVLRPEHDWEGAECALEASQVGMVNEPVNQLRDPAFFREGNEIYLLYSVAGEAGLAIAQARIEGTFQ